MSTTADSDSGSDAEYAPLLFASDPQYDILNFKFGDINVVIHTQELENQHIQPATGMLLWPASRTLCDYMVANKQVFMDQRILELGSGVGLCGIVAAHMSTTRHQQHHHHHHHHQVILTDADLNSLNLLHKNIQSNPHVSTRIATMPLMWGDNDSIAKFQEVHGEQFELIIGSDLIYQSRSLDPLFYTVDKLLSHSPNAQFILAFCDRNNHFPHLMTIVQKYNFQETRIPIESFSTTEGGNVVIAAQLLAFKRIAPSYTMTFHVAGGKRGMEEGGEG